MLELGDAAIWLESAQANPSAFQMFVDISKFVAKEFSWGVALVRRTTPGVVIAVPMAPEWHESSTITIWRNA